MIAKRGKKEHQKERGGLVYWFIGLLVYWLKSKSRSRSKSKKQEAKAKAKTKAKSKKQKQKQRQKAKVEVEAKVAVKIKIGTKTERGKDDHCKKNDSRCGRCSCAVE